MDLNDILGRWIIESWQQEFDDGRVLLPMGDRPDGFIWYGSDGFMSCFVCKGYRNRFETGHQWDASSAERSRAYDEVLAYAGRFEILGDQITHSVELSLYPNWVGGEQHRTASIVSGRLLLTARLEEGGAQARTAKLAWHRAADGPPIS